MRTKKALWNILAAFLLQIVTIAVGMILPRITILTYGSSMNGLLVSITQFIGYLHIIEMGLGGAVIYSLYKPLAEQNILRINRVLSEAKQAYYKVGVYFSFLLVLFMLVYPYLILQENPSRLEVMLLVCAIGATGVINYFTIAKYYVLVTASQSNYIRSLSRMMYLVVSTSLIVFLMMREVALPVVYISVLAVHTLQITLTMAYIKRKHPYINFHVAPDPEASSQRFDILLHQLSGLVVFGAPIVFLTVLSSLSDVSMYSVYAMLFTGLNMFIGLFSSSLSAGFGQVISQGERAKLREAYTQYEYIIYMLVTFLYACILILGIPFLEVYTAGIHDANYIDETLLLLFTCTGVMNNVKIPHATMIVAAGHYKETRKRAVIEAVVTVCALGLCIHWLGLRGALLGSIAGLLFRSIDLWYARKITGVEVRMTFLRLARVIGTGAVAVLPFYTWITIHVSTFDQWIWIAIGVSAWVAVVVWIVNYALEPQTMAALVSRMKRMWSRMKSPDKM